MIKFIRKLIGIGCLFAGFAWGQNTGQNVVSLVTTTSRTITATSTFISPVGSNVSLQNIGQTNHTVVVNVTAAVTTGSNVIQIACVMQASIDGTNWANIGVTATYNLSQSPGVPNQYNCNGYGAYPFIRSNVILTFVGGPSSVTFSIGYQGSSIPANTLIDIDGVLNNVQFVGVQTLVNGGVITTLLSADPIQSIVVYGVNIYSDATPADLNLICSANTGGTIGFRAWNLAIQRVQIYGLSLRPYMTCPIGTSLGYALSGSGVTSLGLQYRYE